MNDNPARLRPEMASLRLLVLDFVRRYWARWGASPSYGEIACALGTNRKRIMKAVKVLATRGELVRVPGPRGLSLPEAEAQALEHLRALGWQVDGPCKRVTNPALPGLAVLDYLPADEKTARKNTRPA